MTKELYDLTMLTINAFDDWEFGAERGADVYRSKKASFIIFFFSDLVRVAACNTILHVQDHPIPSWWWQRRALRIALEKALTRRLSTKISGALESRMEEALKGETRVS